MSTSKSTDALRIGIIGMGGYAGAIADRLGEAQESPKGRVKVVAACDPNVASMPDRAAKLTAVGATVSDSIDTLLADPQVELVWLPIPIDLHRPFAERALAAGKHVVCEKPAAGSVDDVDAMIAARDRSGRECLVGFQDVYQPATQELKRRLVSGELGRPTRVSVLGCWPRALNYFARSTWAGAIKRGDTWVLDSPVNNAMAHFVHLAQYLLGPTEHDSASPVAVEAELYRANDIQNYDTATIRAMLPGNVPLLVGMTHACATSINPVITITTDRMTICFDIQGGVFYGKEGDPDFKHVPVASGTPWYVTDALARRLRDHDASAPVGTLEMARAHTVLINAASEATPIYPLPTGAAALNADSVIAVSGLEAALQRCVNEGKLLHETGAMPWSRPGGRIDLSNGYQHFPGPKQLA